jgi:hypothetical protein
MFRTRRQRRMRERNVEGLRRLDPEEREEVVEAAEHNPDPTTRREAIEQELMELGRSKEGEEIGD